MDAIIILTVIATAVLAIGVCGWAAKHDQDAETAENAEGAKKG